MSLINLAEQGWFPDPLIRFGIKRLLSKRLRKETAKKNNYSEIIKAMSDGPLAIKTDQEPTLYLQNNVFCHIVLYVFLCLFRRSYRAL